MIPVTYPSSVSTSKESQMVVFALPSVTGLQRWTDYIPVKLQSTGADIANSFNTNGYIACDFLLSDTNKQSWIDYIPVFVDDLASVPWQVSDTGYIPFNTLDGGGTYALGKSLDLWFADMDVSYATGATLDLRFDANLYYEWTPPVNPQGSYLIWEGYAPWEPTLNLDFVNTLYQEGSI